MRTPRLTAVLTAWAMLTASAAAQNPDAIPMSEITIGRGAPDVSTWPITARITRLEFTPHAVLVEFDRKDGPNRWPDVRPCCKPNGQPWDGMIQYTLWPVIRGDGGAWWTFGSIEFWYGGGPGGQFSNAAKDWYYSVPEMAGHQPGPGEVVGFFVTAGDQRLKDFHQVAERSNIVTVIVPPADTGVFTFAEPPPVPTSGPAPGPSPVPAPVPPPAGDVCTPEIALLRAELGAKLEAVNTNVTEGRAENRSFFAAVADEWKNVVKKIAIYAGPIIGGIVAGRATK